MTAVPPTTITMDYTTVTMDYMRYKKKGPVNTTNSRARILTTYF